MERVAVLAGSRSLVTGLTELRTEFFRKSIHMLIAFVPFLASFDKGFAMALLGSGVIIYSYSELLRAQGQPFILLSGITELALRERDRTGFAYGPVTLAMGAMAALFFYPAEAAAVAIYALAFGDGFASLIGKLFGKTIIPFTGGKTYTGSAACFIAVFIASSRILGDFKSALFVAFITTAVEALPLGDYDNFFIPVAAGAAVIII